MKDIFDSIKRGTVDIIHLPELEAALSGDTKLRVYFGIDPTGPKAHLGHSVPLRKLREFQKLGHKIIFLIGDFTATIGDPTGRDKMRERLTHEKAKENAVNFIQQANKIIPINDPNNPVEVRYNSEWHGKEDKKDLLEHSFNLTVQQLIERDMFQERIKKGLPISLAEFLYPYFQGYDAVVLQADVQIGGTDQTFNMLMGRDLRKKMSNKIQTVITVPLIAGLDGRKMSKSYGNCIYLDDSPSEIYGKIMSIPDSLILVYFEYFTNISQSALEIIKQELEKDNPKTIKSRLAKVIIEELYGGLEANQAEEEFNRIFVDKQIPNDISEYKISSPAHLAQLLIDVGFSQSKSESIRLINQGGVSFNSSVVDDVNYAVERSGLLQVGKRRFIKIEKE